MRRACHSILRKMLQHAKEDVATCDKRMKLKRKAERRMSWHPWPYVTASREACRGMRKRKEPIEYSMLQHTKVYVAACVL